MKVLVCIGGWGRSEGFKHIISDQVKRSAFMNHLGELFNEYQLDGVDLNWEHPQTEKEWRGLLRLLQDLKRMFPDKILSMSYSPGQEDVFRILQLHEHLDMVHCMSYDQREEHGRHSTMKSAHSAIQAWKKIKLPLAKWNLGIPFYGRNIRTGEAKTFSEIVSANPDLSRKSDIVQDVYFNGPATVERKVNLAKSQGLGGIMIWEIGQDDFNSPLSLFQTIGSILDPKDEL